MVQTGQLLKQRRESLKISIAEVSIATKITPRMVQAIEAGNMELLPARTFLRGFVKSYSTFLKMDVDSVLQSFNEEMTALEPPPPSPLDGTAANQESNQCSSDTRTSAELISDGLSVTKKTSLAIGLVALIGLTVFIYQMVEKYEREAQVQELPTALTPVTPSTPTESEKAAEEEKAESEKTAEHDNDVEDITLTEAKTEKPAAEATPTIAQAPAAPAAPAAEPAKPVVQPPAQPPPPQPEPAKPTAAALAPTAPAATNANQELIVEALDRVDLSFRINGGELKKVTLQPDQYHTIKATGSINLDISDGGAVNVIHNGRDLGVPGDLGRPKKLQIP